MRGRIADRLVDRLARASPQVSSARPGVVAGIGESTIVVAPDLGAVELARAYSNHLHVTMAFVHKTRLNGEAVVAHAVIGDVRGRLPLIVDDMSVLAPRSRRRWACCVRREQWSRCRPPSRTRSWSAAHERFSSDFGSPTSWVTDSISMNLQRRRIWTSAEWRLYWRPLLHGITEANHWRTCAHRRNTRYP